MTPSPLDRPLAPLISSLLDAAHESHADRKLQHPKTQQYAMFEWQLQEAAAERSQQQQRSGRSRRQTEDNVSLATVSAAGINGGSGGSAAGFGARPRRQTETDLSYVGSGASKGLLGMQQRTSSASGMSLFDPDEGGLPTCNLEVSQPHGGSQTCTGDSIVAPLATLSDI